MDIETAFDDDLARRLPLPLAQLYRRAHNAKGPRDRHDTAYCLWEAALKLLGATAIVAYAERGAPAPELAERLRNLARPALGHSWEFVRLLVPVLADAGDEGFRAARDLVLGRARDDLPRAAGLDAALRETLDGTAGARVTVRLSELFDRLVRYRNREIGHGAAGQRPAEFYDRMGRGLRLGVPELLGRLDVLAGRRLISVTDVRAQSSGAWLVERHELIGEAPRRLESQERPESEAARLPKPGRLYLVAPGPATDDEPAWYLHPLVLYDHEAEEVFFLNARRGRRRTEYLCYYPGRTVERPDLGGERRELLAHVLGGPVDEGQAEQWAAQSQAEEPPGPPEAIEAPRRLGEFELLSELGRGGMGVVYRAWQPSLGRQVALKSLIRAGDPKAEARFNREIHALGRVEHPNLVKVFTSGAEADRWFYAMELIEGATLGAVCGRLQGRGSTVTELDLETWRETLSTACQEARAAERPLSADDTADARPARSHPEARPPAGAAGRDYVHHVVDLVRQVSEAAHVLHEAGVIHRDIKPDNVLVTPDGAQAVLMDLGLAQLADEAEGRLTRTRQFVGTLRYASPEQVLSVPLDRRSDVYSLGVTLWELLTLRPMFGATDQTPTPELMLKVQQADPESPRRLNPRVPEDLEAIVLKCLEKDRGRRYGTAQELADDLGRWLLGEPVQAQPPTLGYLLGKSLRRHRVAVALTSAVLLALLLGGVAAVSLRVAYRLERLRQSAEKARLLAETERDRADQARQGEVEARAKEAEARRNAEGLKEELRLRLLEQVDIANGVKLMDQGDLFGSLAWFADAHRLEQGDPESADRLRIRMNAVLQRSPRLNQMLFHDDVHYADFSPDSSRVVTVSSQEVRVWDVATGEPISPPLKLGGKVKHAVFSPDGRRLLTTSEAPEKGIKEIKVQMRDADSEKSVQSHPALQHVHPAGRGDEVRVWDADTGQPVTRPMKHVDVAVNHAEFSPDGRRLATAGEDGTARVWDADTGQPVTQPMKNGGRVRYAVFSPDGRRLLTASGDCTARVWDAGTGQPVTQPMKYDAEASVVQAAFTPNGPRLVTLDKDGTARVWDAGTGQPVTRPMTHGGEVSEAALSLDGRRLVTTSGGSKEAGEMRMWDVATGQLIAPPMRQDKEAAVNRAEFSPDSRRLVTVSQYSTVRVWDADTGRPLAPPLKHERWVNRAEFSPDGRRLVTVSRDGTAWVWDMAAAQPLAPPLMHGSGVIHAEFSPDGRRVVSVSADGTAQVWDAETAQPLAPRLKHEGEVRYAAFSPDGHRVVTVTNVPGKVDEARVWDADTGRPLAPPLEHTNLLRHAAFSPDGRRVVTAGAMGIGAGEALVWDADTGRPLAPPLKHKGEVRYAAFSPDGRRVVTDSEDGTAQVWDVETGRPLAPPLKYEGKMHYAAFSPDGRRVDMASEDGTAQVWDVDTGQTVTRPMKHGGKVGQKALSPDWRRLLTIDEGFGQAGEVRVWDTDTGQLLAPPMEHGGKVLYAAFSPDGRRVVTVGDDRAARVWDADTGRPLAPRKEKTEDLMALARLLSGMKVDRSSAVDPLTTGKLRTVWQDLRTRYPEVFVCSPQEIRSWHWREAAACEDAGAWTGAVRHLGVLITADPESWMLLGRRGRAYAELGQWEQAGADLARAIEQDAGAPGPRIGLTLVHLARGDTDGYRRACTRLLGDFGQRDDALVTDEVAWTCTLVEGAVADREAVVRCAQIAVKFAQRDRYSRHDCLQTLGAATYRDGRFEQAVAHLNKAIQAARASKSGIGIDHAIFIIQPTLKPDASAGREVSPDSTADGNPLDWLFLAMAHHRLGHAVEARKWLDKAISRIGQDTQGLQVVASSRPLIDWKTRLYYQVLRREAEGLIGGMGADRTKAAGGKKSQ
jgi:WD40 repeat protein/serine/threonine protein kinase/tetratricopeptide (TPR) repeat protein